MKKGIKIFCSVCLALFLALLFVVIFQSSVKPLDKIIATDSMKNAYGESGEIRTHAPKEEFSKNGAVYAYSFVYIPNEKYLQLTVRYNERHIDEIRETYPDFKDEYISYVLLSSSGEEYIPNVIEKAEKFHYRYFKLEFTGVDFDNDLTLKMLLTTLDFDGGELLLHAKDNTYINYKLSNSEKKQLN